MPREQWKASWAGQLDPASSAAPPVGGVLSPINFKSACMK